MRVFVKKIELILHLQAVQTALQAQNENLAPPTTPASATPASTSTKSDFAIDSTINYSQFIRTTDQKIQVNIPKPTRTRRIQVTIMPQTASVGVQCNIWSIENFLEVNPKTINAESHVEEEINAESQVEEEDDDEDMGEEIEEDPLEDDPDWEMENEEMESGDESDESQMEESTYIHSVKDPLTEKQILVSESALYELLHQCRTCHASCNVELRCVIFVFILCQ